MIASLRKRHLWIWLGLGLLLPALLVVAVWSRRSIPRMSEWPGPLTATTVDGRHPLDESRDLWDGMTADSRLIQDTSGRFFMEILAKEVPLKADMLVYWQQVRPESQLAASAVLLGTLVNEEKRLYALPETFPSARGFLVVFSLGHGEIVARADLAALNVEKGGGR